MKTTYEIKMGILESGKSERLKDWQKNSTITKEQFAEAIAWICEDSKNYAALTPTGWEKIHRVDGFEVSSFRHPDGRIWDGSWFDVPLSEKEQAFYGVTHMPVRQMIAISSRDRI